MTDSEKGTVELKVLISLSSEEQDHWNKKTKHEEPWKYPKGETRVAAGVAENTHIVAWHNITQNTEYR